MTQYPNKYVVGFLFNQEMNKVVLIQKNRPEWQKGLLNGVGGKVERSETFEEAMYREFKEETGLVTNRWDNFAVVAEEGDYAVYFFCTTDYDADKATTQTDEEIFFIPVEDISNMPNIIPNLRWLIPMAIDRMSGNYHAFHAVIKQRLP